MQAFFLSVLWLSEMSVINLTVIITFFPIKRLGLSCSSKLSWWHIITWCDRVTFRLFQDGHCTRTHRTRGRARLYGRRGLLHSSQVVRFGLNGTKDKSPALLNELDYSSCCDAFDPLEPKVDWLTYILKHLNVTHLSCHHSWPGMMVFNWVATLDRLIP